MHSEVTVVSKWLTISIEMIINIKQKLIYKAIIRNPVCEMFFRANLCFFLFQFNMMHTLTFKEIFSTTVEVD